MFGIWIIRRHDRLVESAFEPCDVLPRLHPSGVMLVWGRSNELRKCYNIERTYVTGTDVWRQRPVPETEGMVQYERTTRNSKTKTSEPERIRRVASRVVLLPAAALNNMVEKGEGL